MNKVIRDGHVAVIFSPGHGAGWYTWHNVEELVYDPVIVEMIENVVHPTFIEEYCEKTYGDNHYYGGAHQLAIVWMPEGTEFIINEYDGHESVEYKDSMQWMKA
jgi:hypothetical protein